jgi:F-type H+-transporting ATPase subunit a
MNELVQELSRAMMPNTLFRIYGIPITDTILTMWIIMAILIAFAYVLGRKLELVPSKIQNFGEVLVDSLNGISKDAIGHHWRGFAPYIGTIALFLGVSNIISIFNILPNWHEISKIPGFESVAAFPQYSLRPPAKDINVTAAMAIMSIILVIGASLKYRKLSGFIKSFFEPVPFLFPFKILEYFIKPLSLCLRLFGNILAAFTIMELIYFASKSFIMFIVPAVIPSMFSVYFDLFDGLLQAYIFSFLTSLYIGEAIEEEAH